ncbi:MAG: hypothetical protein V4721_07135 [Bacteroidota bacterium]
MKKIIIIALVTGFISFGFTIATTAPKAKVVAKTQSSEKMDFSQKLNEKRLASWD